MRGDGRRVACEVRLWKGGCAGGLQKDIVTGKSGEILSRVEWRGRSWSLLTLERN